MHEDTSSVNSAYTDPSKDSSDHSAADNNTLENGVSNHPLADTSIAE